MQPLPESDLNHILDHTRDLWEELRGERIFITGGTGFFGCWLLESFFWANDRLNLDCHATVLTRSPHAFRTKEPHFAEHEAITLLEGDVRTFKFPAGTFSHIIHAASETNSQFIINPLEIFNANIGGTRRMLELADKCEARKILFTSSGAVYGKQPPEMTHIPEDYNGAPETTDLTTAYGQSKRASEFLCAATESSGLQAKIARCFAFVGPHLPLDGNFAVGNFIRDGLKGGPILVQGDGTPWRSYLYAADLAIWLWTILFRGEGGRVYNIGSENALNIAALAQMVRNIVSPGCDIKVAHQPVIGHPAERYVPSTLRARQELGLQELIGLEEGVRRMAKWNMERSSD